MPLLNGLRNAEVVDGSVHNGLQPVQPVDAILDTVAHGNALNKRRKIVVVGLGMVAISFMYVGELWWWSWPSEYILRANRSSSLLAKRLSSKILKGGTTI